MIINNHNNSLPENIETQATFLYKKSPIILVREFPSRIDYTDRLSIPYYVNDWSMGEAWKNQEDKTFQEVLGPTFTAVVTMLNPDYSEGEVLAKKTTYHGEQVLEVGPFTSEDVGERVLILKCIQSDGTGSVAHPLKVLIEDPEDEAITVDLTEENSFTSSFPFIEDSSQADTPTNASTRYTFVRQYEYAYGVKDGKWAWRWMSMSVTNGYTNVAENASEAVVDYRTVKQTIVADYEVSVEYNQDDSVRYIEIGVSQDSNSDDGDTVFSDKGFIYGIDPFMWDGYGWNRNYATGDVRTKVRKTYKDAIGGTYRLTTEATDGVNTYKLIDYVDKQPSEVPYCVVQAAVENKVALTRLMEAAKALGTDGEKVILKLPNMPIVIDHRRFSDPDIQPHNGTLSDFVNDYECMTKTDAVISERPDTSGYSPQGKLIIIHNYRMKNMLVSFPNRFCLDLNGSTIYALQSSVSTNGQLLRFISNYDTHVVNGGIHGIYKYIDYANTESYPEKIGNTTIIGSSFCTFEDMDMAYSQGYDANFCSLHIAYSGSTNSKPDHKKPFNTLGYIDYEGNYVNPYSDVEDQVRDYDCIMRCNMNQSDLSKYGVYNIYGVDRSLLDGFCIALYRTDAKSSSGIYSKTVNSEMFVHYYHYEDGDYNFLRTEKVHEYSIMFPPKQATHMFMSSYGINLSDDDIGGASAKIFDILKSGSGVGFFVSDMAVPSWCCGYIRCDFHDYRTSIADNETDYQCYFSDCRFWNLGEGRMVIAGGRSTNGYFMDIEDEMVIRNTNNFMTRCDNIYGKSDAIFHASYNFNAVDVHGFGFQFDKAVFGPYLDRVTGSLTEGPAFSVPIRYDVITNTMLNELTSDTPKQGQGPKGNCTTEILIKDSSIYVVDGAYANKIFKNNCKIYRT